jgi:ferredoxin
MNPDQLKQDAASVLEDGRANLVIGFRRRAGDCVPAFLTSAEAAENLVYDETCIANTAAYLRKPEIRERRPVALVARPEVMRSLVLLKAENQVTDDDVLVLAVGDETYHGVLTLSDTEALLNEQYADLAPDEETLAQIARLEEMTPEERAAFWSEQLAKCTRCYACRAACPMCYCERCIVERNVPQWISTAAREHGNYAWNVIRAFHLAGRCTECGACEAACPQGIPLMLLNALMAREVRDTYGEKPGYDGEAQPVIGSWNQEDEEDFIR